ncbi:DUF349 domain-containing protein [Aureibacter tunicatorum]|uniref:Vacuolar-type H+-ATPase subunit I/STV1 n=1 Tax=Aureibacter tunicatorum TaxID=866807 RepID=A0AAE4BRG5_9BACT|nr:DUF349 domain-containing protein [Aureibacter tunicatorum]MDR6240189.1 vacuolar-type H+-ATPase subunit I/STV1 [Aureibacter tunicatorum]BDD05930.1 hypothetical protein AUTU_34130 [Aureibacter tunicatorum]
METNEYGIIKDGKVYLKAFLDYPERQIGEVKGSDESSLQYFVDRFEVAKGKVDELVNMIESATNKGSFLMKLVHLRKYLLEFDGLGDYTPLLETLNRYEQQIQELIDRNRIKNLEIKRALLLEAEAVKELKDWKEATEKFKDLKIRWLKTGSVGPDNQEVEQQFDEILNGFFEKKKEFYQEKQSLIKDKVSAYQDLVDKAEAFKESENLASAADELKKLQQQWKTLEPIPAKFRNELWEKFRAANDEVFNRLKKERQVERAQKQGETLTSMVERAEALAESTQNDHTSASEVNKLMSEWKKTLRFSKSTVDSKLMDRFYFACDKVTERGFVDKLCKSKFKGFDQKDKFEQDKLKLRILQDLYHRDQKDLDLFNENMDKFGLGGNEISSMLSGKHQVKERKVRVKKALIAELKSQLK